MTDQTPATAPVPAQDVPGGPGRQPDATTLLERSPRTTPDNSAASSDAADNSLRTALTEVLGYLYSLERVGGSVIGYQTVNVISPASYDRWQAVLQAAVLDGKEQP